VNLVLPPVPENPVRPPMVDLPGEEPFRIDTVDGHSLEARLRLPSDARRAVVLCHPHPLYGGTMHNAVIVAVAKTLAQADEPTAVLRFNFRGVERSSGRYSEGQGEKLDVLAAIDGLRNMNPRMDISVVGYSFGSWVGMRAAWEHPEVERLALIAPAARVFSYVEDQECRRPLPTFIAVGDQDGFASVDSVRKLASYLGAHLDIIHGADHFFVGYRRTLATRLMFFIAPTMGK